MVHHLGAMLGSLAAAKESAIAGLGVPATKLTLALLALPSFWDWYLRWRERNRRCKTSTELTLLYLGKTLLRPHTGWLRQHPRLVKHLHAIDGLIQQCEVKRIRLNWAAACDAAYVYVTDRIGELLRDNRQAGDPFEAIAAVLNTDEPLIEYKKIADEIRKDIPRRPKFSLQAAIAARSYITVRILMHLGLRQRNARELLLCQKDQKPRTMQQLEVMERGELRWSESLRRWEVIIPAIAFKNGKSSYFRGCPYRATLADVDRLYYFLDQYIRHYRPILVGKFPDPGTLIVKTASCAAYSGSFDGVTFYHLWKTIIRRYGIFNPYTRRGAVKGLLPHGPHCVRDVIATHVLKVTGSYELAGFAIQDNAQTVARHYARFLPHEKADRAARVLDQVWSRK